MRNSSQISFWKPGVAGRHLTIAIASLTLIAQFSSFAHLLLVRHVICPEHGELIDLDEQDGSAPSRAVAKVAPPGNTAIQAMPETPAEQGHNHCPLAFHRREGNILSPCSVAAVNNLPQSVSSYRVEDTPRPALVALFRVAPKNSPPT